MSICSKSFLYFLQPYLIGAKNAKDANIKSTCARGTSTRSACARNTCTKDVYLRNACIQSFYIVGIYTEGICLGSAGTKIISTKDTYARGVYIKYVFVKAACVKNTCAEDAIIVNHLGIYL